MEGLPLKFGLAQRHYRELIKVFSDHLKINQVLIFGSRATGNAKSYSDFDLAVFAPSMNAREFSALWDQIDALPLVFQIDLLHWDQLTDNCLKEKILLEGKLFYPEKN